MSVPPFLSLDVRSKCSAASATKETPAIAAFSHFLYAEDAVPQTAKQTTRCFRLIVKSYVFEAKLL